MRGRVLHVDDSEAVERSRRLAARREWEFELTTATGGTAALETLRDRRVDCLVSGRLDGPDGRPFVLEARWTCPQVPIVMLSAEPWRAVSSTARAANVSEFVRRDGSAGIETAFRCAASLVRSPGADESTERPRQRTTDGGWRVIETWDWEDEDDLVLALAEAVESVAGAGATRDAPLFEAIDTDALERVLASASGRREERGVQVRFHYCGYELLVGDDGTIAARAAPPESRA